MDLSLNHNQPHIPPEERAKAVQYFANSNLHAVLNILCPAETGRIVESVWIVYLLSVLETQGLLPFMPDYAATFQNLQFTYNHLTEYLFILLGQVMDGDVYIPEGACSPLNWLHKLIEDLNTIRNAHQELETQLPPMKVDVYDLWMYYVYFSKDLYGMADVVRRQLGEIVWLQRLKTPAILERGVFQTTHKLISLYRKRIGCLYLAYNQRNPDRDIQKYIITIKDMLAIDLHYLHTHAMDEKDLRNMTEIEHKLLILYLDTLMPMNIQDSCFVVARLIALEQQPFAIRESNQNHSEWLKFISELSGNHGFVSSESQGLNELIQRALAGPHAIAKNRLLMMTYVFIYNIWGGLAYQNPVEGPLMMSLIRLLIPLTKRHQEGEEAKVCLYTMAMWLRELIMRTPDILMNDDIVKDFLYNTAHGNGLILKTMQYGNYGKNFTIQIRMWNELIETLQDSFFELSRQVLNEMAETGVKYKTPRDLVKRMDAKNPLIFKELSYYVDVIQSFFEIWVEKIKPENSAMVEVYMLRLWVYFNYVLFTLYFNFLQWSDHCHPMLMILAYSNILQGDFEVFDLRIFERIYPLMQEHYKMFCYFTNDGRTTEPNFSMNFNLCDRLLRERSFRYRNVQEIYKLMDLASEACKEKTRAINETIRTAAAVTDRIGLEIWQEAKKNEKRAFENETETQLALSNALDDHALKHPVPSLESIVLDQMGKNTLCVNIKAMRVCLLQTEILKKDKSYVRFLMHSNTRITTATRFLYSDNGEIINMLIRPSEFQKTSHLYRHFKSNYRRPRRSMQIMVTMNGLSY